MILASGSPRRRELLDAMGVRFEVIRSNVDESKIIADHPRTYALRAAFAKAKEVADRIENDRWVLGADTVVTRRMRLYGKPETPEDARRILGELSGETHEVITGMALVLSGAERSHLLAESTRVTFQQLSSEQIDVYIASGEPMDKAGAYGIQGAAEAFIDHIEGDYFNVVGLPCEALSDLMAEAELPAPASLPDPPERFR